MPWIAEKDAREEEAGLAVSQGFPVAARLLRRLQLLETALDAISECVCISAAGDAPGLQSLQPLYCNKAACDALASVAASASPARGSGRADQAEAPSHPPDLTPALEQCSHLLISEVAVGDDPVAVAGRGCDWRCRSGAACR